MFVATPSRLAKRVLLAAALLSSSRMVKVVENMPILLPFAKKGKLAEAEGFRASKSGRNEEPGLRMENDIESENSYFIRILWALL